MTFEFLAAADIWNTVKEGIPVVLALILIEGLLSVDNALAIAAMASHLDEAQRKTAMNIGYIGAYGFRILALLTAQPDHGQPLADAGWIALPGMADVRPFCGAGG